MSHTDDAVFDAIAASKKQPKARAASPAARPAGDGTGDYKTLDIERFMRAHGLYGRDLGNKMHTVECPWENEHTDGKGAEDTDTVVWEASDDKWPGFCCKHTHCKGRGIEEVIAKLGDADRFCSRMLESPTALDAERVASLVQLDPPPAGVDRGTADVTTRLEGEAAAVRVRLNGNDKHAPTAAGQPEDDPVSRGAEEIFAAAEASSNDVERLDLLRELAATLTEDRLEADAWAKRVSEQGWTTKGAFLDQVAAARKVQREAQSESQRRAIPQEYTQGQHGSRVIDASDEDLPRVTAAAWNALIARNDPPSLFRHGNIPVRLEADDTGRLITRMLTEHRMRLELSKAAAWFRFSERSGERPAVPPPHVVQSVLATSNMPLPILHRIVATPVFAPDGTLQTAPGYHPASRTYYQPAPGLVIPTVSPSPTDEELQEAVGWIRSGLLGDFPFTGDPEQAHAIAFLLLPFARDLIDGATPLHLFEKPAPGTGATLLVNALIYPALGQTVQVMTEARDEEEWRKRLTAQLRTSPAVTLIDNLRRRLDSAALSAILTARVWQDRLIASSEMLCLPVQTAWAATGNNPALSNEMSRRSVRIRLDAKTDQPWLRKGFRHPKLLRWAGEKRPQLIWAALTVIQAWIAAGRPLLHEEPVLGEFEEWSVTMGSILKKASIEGFLGNLQEFYRSSDSEGRTWRTFIGAWWDQFPDADADGAQTVAVGVAELWPLVNALDGGPNLGDGSEKSQKTRLGDMLSKAQDRRFSIAETIEGEDVAEVDAKRFAVQLVAVGTRKRAQLYRLLRAQPSDAASAPTETRLW